MNYDPSINLEELDIQINDLNTWIESELLIVENLMKIKYNKDEE